MTKFTDDHKRIKAIRVSLNEAFESVEDAYGIKLNIGNISFTATTFTTKLEASIVGEDGIVEDKQRSDFKTYATLHRLDPDWLDKEITLKGRVFRVTGLNTKASKNTIRIEDTEGRSYGCPSKNLNHFFGEPSYV
jgi:hypothetical protein